MEVTFTGVWHKNNQLLVSKLTRLEKLVGNEFGIEISVPKMLVDEAYRQLVISELTQLAHPDINEMMLWLQPANLDITKGVKENSNSRKIPYIILLMLTTLIMAASFIWFEKTNSSADTVPPVELTSAISQEPTNISRGDIQIIKPTLNNVSSNEVAISRVVTETVFRLHGSNTIGEKLAPMLLEGFLKQQGVNEFSWTNTAPLERVLHYSIGAKNYAIELNAHGSSTAFSALKNKSADIGMSSRRIKDSEVKLLAKSEGTLNRLGNEHIIGLDGLAVIVNQNNSVKQLTSKTLAKIFSGEINNWAQLGGMSTPIKLYARDQHSGTWDTFKNLVLKKHNKKLSIHANRLESSSELSTFVSQDEAAIGFIGLNYVSHNKAIAISESKETNAIFPTRFTVGTEDYALSRRLYFYTPTTASNLVKNFAQYALSMQGQQVVSAAGLISQNIKLEKIHPLAKSPKIYQEYAATGKRLSLNFRFDYATKDLDNKGKRDLQRLVSFMEQHESRRIVLMGFSDSIGAVAKNNLLSLKRAKSVELALTSRGIPVLAVEAMGEALPIANNDTEAGRKRNRRVEVWLL